MLESLPTTGLAFIDPTFSKSQFVFWILFLKCVIMSKKYYFSKIWYG